MKEGCILNIIDRLPRPVGVPPLARGRGGRGGEILVRVLGLLVAPVAVVVAPQPQPTVALLVQPTEVAVATRLVRSFQRPECR